MRTLIICIAALLSFTNNLAAQVATKTFSKSFHSENKEKLNLDLPGAVDLKIWDSPSIKIEISIGLSSGNAAMLNELANVGRYNLISKAEEGQLLITAPNIAKQVKIKGEPLKESFNFVVFVPKSMKVEIQTRALALNEKKE
jgi:hypothetical protein